MEETVKGNDSEEWYLNMIQTSDAAILDEAVSRIQEAVRPMAIILFGSRARGDYRPTSDYDLLVITESHEPRSRRSAPLYRLLADLPIEVEIAVYSPQEVSEWRETPSAFVTTAIREGRLLYEKR